MTLPQSYPKVRPSGLSWAPFIPAHWNVCRAKYIFNLERRPVRDLDEVVTAFRDGQVTLRNNRRIDGFTNAEKEIGYQGVRKGDLVIHAMDAFAGAVGVSDSDGKCTPVYSCCTPIGAVSTAFYGRMLRTMALTGFIESLAKGIRERSTDFRWREFANVSLPVPPLQEQEAIANYIDRETGRIQRLIDRKLSFADLLSEKAGAIAAHAVSVGISTANKIEADGPTWLGSVPGHWRTVRIAELFQETARPADPNLPVLAVSIHDGVSDKELEDDDRLRKVNLSEDRTKYQRVKPGDLVYNMMRAWQGAFGTVTVDGLVSPAYVVAEPKAEFRTKFIELQLRTASGAEEVRRYSKGIADFRQRLYWEHFRNIKVCLPPLDEQDAIIAHIESEQTRLGLLKAKTEKSIELLREHRSALITAAVTGKIDVRNAA